MREIKFRGLTIDSHKWVYGFPCIDNDKAYILPIRQGYDFDDIDFGYAFIEIIPESLGQYTVLKDKNEKEIYEKDLIQSVGAHRLEERVAIISWCDEDTGFEAIPVECRRGPWRLSALNPRFWQVIGNICENHDILIKEGL